MFCDLIMEHRDFDLIYPKKFNEKAFGEILGKEMQDSNCINLIAYENKIPVGFIRGRITRNRPDRTKDVAMLLDIYVNKDWRRQKVGTRLYDAFVRSVKKSKIKRIELSVDIKNKQAVTFWRLKGFFDFQLRLKTDLS